MAKFAKGQVANPNGRPKAHTLAEIRGIARRAAPEMVEILVSIARNEEEAAAARVAAANHVLNRGYGQPAQSIADEEGNAMSWFDLLAASQRRAGLIEQPPLKIEARHDVN